MKPSRPVAVKANLSLDPAIACSKPPIHATRCAMQDGRSRNGALLRTVGLGALVVYGVGDMVGAGIYATIGQAAGLMGNAVWIAFVGSMIAAMLTGLSYACIASRHPRAAGAAYVTQRAFAFPLLSYVVGLIITASGLTSIATGAHAFKDALLFFAPTIHPLIAIAIFLLALTLINLRGIRECVAANILCTAIEVGGLLFVVAVGLRFVGAVNYLETPPAQNGLDLGLVLSGAVLTFYAFVGFEDLLNLSEEVEEPRRNMPLGIIGAVLIVTAIYLAIAITAVSVVPYAELADPANGPPLEQITRRAAPWVPPGLYTAITLFAVFNTALMNYIMGSRLLYGMSRQGLLPRALGIVHPKRHTPYVAIFSLCAIIAALTQVGRIKELASATSLLLLFCFTVVNASLMALKLRKNEPCGHFEVPAIVPFLGILVCGGLVVARVQSQTAGKSAPAIAAALVLLAVILFFIIRPRQAVMDDEPQE
jgi:amino acid transporter